MTSSLTPQEIAAVQAGCNTPPFCGPRKCVFPDCSCLGLPQQILSAVAALHVSEASKTIATIRNLAIDECVTLARAHKGAAKRDRETKFPNKMKSFSIEEQDVILAEERGEDSAAEQIAEAILALKLPYQQRK